MKNYGNIMSEEQSKEPKDKQENQPEIKAENQNEKKEMKKEVFQQHQEIEKLQAEKDEIFGRLQRVSADFANYQKRSVKQISESIAYEKEHIIKSLFPVLDNFEHTLVQLDKIENAAEVVKGVRMIYEQFLGTLKSHGVETITAVGEKFDPSCHQALTQRSEPDKEDMIVLEEFRKGYRMAEKILRPSIVIVNKKAPAEPKQEETKVEDTD
ncbi:MAG: nucleotide exchange factor GrpE [Phycisphaerales bacterium]